MLPQLAQVAKDPYRYLESTSWAMEEKFDGDRLLIAYTDKDRVSAYGRKGTEMAVPRIKTARNVLEFRPLKKNTGLTVIDGEILPDGVFQIFDIPTFFNKNTAALTYEKRRGILQEVIPKLFPEFTLVESVTEPDQKLIKFKQIHADKLEGVMFKHLDSPYYFDTRSDKWLKWKFYKSCSAIITEMNREGKSEAVTICVFDGDQLWEISGLKIPSRYQQEYSIGEGDIVEVRYLTWTKDRQITQPCFLKKRTDIPMANCTIEQF